MDEPTLNDFINYLRDHEDVSTVIDHPGILPDLVDDFYRFWKEEH